MNRKKCSKYCDCINKYLSLGPDNRSIIIIIVQPLPVGYKSSRHLGMKALHGVVPANVAEKCRNAYIGFRQ